MNRSPTPRTRARETQFRLLLLSLSILVSGIFCESLYRAYLLGIGASDRFTRKIPDSISVYSEPFWIYDEKFGYRYARTDVPSVSIQAGKVVACNTWTHFNERGNIGAIEGSYDDAELKILVFGDSFTAFVQEGETWPRLLQRRLQERLHSSVHVVNFGRDGYGVLQMLDLAAAMVPEWQPDLAIIAFITNDLQRIRFWRTPTRVDGSWRYLVSPRATPNPDPRESYDTALFHPEATPEWCERMRTSGDSDHILREVQAAYRKGISVGESRAANPLTLRHSYLLARLRYGDPFHELPGFFAFPVVQARSYAEDARFVAAVKRLTAAGIPYVLVHLAFYPEIKEGKEYLLNFAEKDLLSSLEEVTDHRIHETTSYLDMPLAEPERMNVAPDNYHPSLLGMQLYADVTSEILIRDGLVPRPPTD